jgi:hypothetical protein
MATFSTFYCDTNYSNSSGGKLGLQCLGFEFFEKIIMENIGIKVGSNLVMDDTIVVDSPVRIIGMSPFSNPLRDLTSIPKFSTLTYNFCWNTFSCI